MPVDLVRDAAVDILLRVFERGIHLDVSLDKTLRRKKPSDRGRRFMTQLAYGTVRHRLLCDFVLQKLCHQPLDELPPQILCIMRMGIFQSLFCDNVTHPAMVHTSVDLAKRRHHAGTARMVNAVLRKAPQSLEDIKFPDRGEDLHKHLRIRYSMPKWLARDWMKQFGDETAEALCKACDEPAQTAIRVNTQKTDPETLQQNLAKSGCMVSSQTPIPEEMTLLQGTGLVKTKWFQRGDFMIQDPASMLPPHLLDAQPGEKVLDLCSAPGGKTTHIAQLTEDKAHIVALDAGQYRLHRVIENADRLELESIVPCCGDGERPPLQGEFDRILVDAPCSGLGTLRRHPDIKLHIKPMDIQRLAQQQIRLLRSAIALCKNNGVIVYSVCTISQEETEGVLQEILEDGQVCCEDGPEFLNTWKIATGKYRTLPTSGALDGFFLTRLRKQS